MQTPGWNASTGEPPKGLRRLTAAALAAALVFALCTVSAAGRWPQLAPQLLILLTGAAWLVGWAIRPFRVWRAGVLIPLAALPAWAAFQLAAGLTEYRFATLEALQWFLCWLTLAALVLQLVPGGDERRKLRRILAGFGSVFAAVSLVQMCTSAGRVLWIFPTAYQDQVLGPFVNADHYAAFVLLLLPAALAECTRDGRWIAGAAVMTASIAAGGSRAGTLLAGAEIALMLGREWWSRPAARGRVLSAALAVAALTGLAGWDSIAGRWMDAGPVKFRLRVLESAAGMLRERPLAGFGLGTWDTVYPGYARFDDGTRVNHAHNDWAEWAAEGGLIMPALLAWVAFFAVRGARGSVWTAGTVAVLAHALADYPLHKTGIALWWVLLLAAGGGQGAKKPKKSN